MIFHLFLLSQETSDITVVVIIIIVVIITNNLKTMFIANEPVAAVFLVPGWSIEIRFKQNLHMTHFQLLQILTIFCFFFFHGFTQHFFIQLWRRLWKKSSKFILHQMFQEWVHVMFSERVKFRYTFQFYVITTTMNKTMV